MPDIPEGWCHIPRRADGSQPSLRDGYRSIRVTADGTFIGLPHVATECLAGDTGAVAAAELRGYQRAIRDVGAIIERHAQHQDWRVKSSARPAIQVEAEGMARALRGCGYEVQRAGDDYMPPAAAEAEDVEPALVGE